MRWTLLLLTILCLANVGRADEPELTGAWKGTFSYPARAGRKPVPFSAILLRDGDEVRGVVVESNTFGEQGVEPQLHAWVQRGRYVKNSREVRYSKQYIGTDQVDHLVEYRGTLSSDGSSIGGTWQIPGGWGASFQLNRVPLTGPGPMAGVWTGMYRYAQDDQDADGRPRPPVIFSMYLVQRGRGWWGYSEEPRTFGYGSAPRLFATIDGRPEGSDGEFLITKTYDGTAGQNHSVDYRGRREANGKLSGTWDVPGESHGLFVALGDGLNGDGGLPLPDEIPTIPVLPSFEQLSRGTGETTAVESPPPSDSQPANPNTRRRRR